MKSWIPVRCFTNLDKYRRSEWPSRMICRPQVGDYVLSDVGDKLRVVRIIHAGPPDNPKLIVELHN